MNIVESWKSTQEKISLAVFQSKTGPCDEGILREIQNSFTDYVDFAKSILISTETIFYGSILAQLEIHVDYTRRNAFDLEVKREVRVLLNPLFMRAWSFQEFLGGLVQEICMIPLDVVGTFHDMNPTMDMSTHYLLEKSTHASISSTIMNDISNSRGASTMASPRSIIRLRKDAYTTNNLSFDISRPVIEKESIGYYYDCLKNNDRSDEFNSEMMMALANAAAPGQTNLGDSDGVASPENNAGKTSHTFEGVDTSDVRGRFKQIVGSALAASGGLDRQRGDLPGGLIEAIAKMMAPPQIKWQDHLRNMIGTIPWGKTPTRMRLNRRQPYRADLRGHFPDRHVEVVCVFDTSGSMSNDDITTCMTEVIDITKNYKTVITVIECDTKVNKVYTVKKVQDLQTDIRGRGGTMFTPAIEYINGDASFEGKYVRKGHFSQSLMIYFTDGYGEREIPKPKTYKNLWVVIGGADNLSLKEPYGKVAGIETKKYK